MTKNTPALAFCVPGLCVLAVMGCTSVGEPLTPEEFTQIVTQYTGETCPIDCGGSFDADGWAALAGWRTTGGARRVAGDPAIYFDSAGELVMTGPEWHGAFEITATITLSSGVLELQVDDGADAATGFRVESALETVRAFADTSADESALGDRVEVDLSQPVTVTIRRTCARLTLEVGGRTYTRQLATAGPGSGGGGFSASNVRVVVTGGPATVEAMSFGTDKCEDIFVPQSCLEEETQPGQCATLGEGPCRPGVCSWLGSCVVETLPSGTTCDDASNCTTGDLCDASGSCTGEVRDCSDGDPCTDDTCIPSSGECSNPLRSGGGSPQIFMDFESESTPFLDVANNHKVGDMEELAPAEGVGWDRRSDGVNGACLRLRGELSVNITDSVGLGNADWSATAWVRPYGPIGADGAVIIGEKNTDADGLAWACGLRADGHLELGPPGAPLVASTVPVPTDRWTWVGCSHDESGYSLWIDGERDAVVASDQKFSGSGHRIGGDGTGRRFHGDLDDVRLWASALAVSQACQAEAQCSVAFCLDGASGCVSRTELTGLCETGDDCSTAPACDPATGCTGTPTAVVCGEDDSCTTHLCDFDGGCRVEPVVCEDDQNPCTVDQCVLVEDPADACNQRIIGCAVPLADWTVSRGILLTDPESPEGGSVVARQDELITIPLLNGQNDASVVWFPFDDDALDANGGAGQAVSGGSLAPTTVTGLLGAGAANFGTLGRVTFGRTLGERFTFMFWLSRDPANAVDAGALGVLEVPGSEPFRLNFKDDSVKINPPGGTPQDLGYAPAGEWHHIALVWDGSTGAGVAYFDGVAVQSFDYDLSGVEEFSVGPPAGMATDEQDLIFDDLVITPWALTATEVASYVSSGRAFGVPLFPASQADYDDIRITDVAGEVVPFDVTGRRPHSDSPERLADVLAYYRLDGSLTPTAGGGGDVAGAIEVTEGVFGDAGGGIRPVATNTELFGDRSALTENFSVEFWYRSGLPVSCDTGDGAVLVQTAFGQTDGGWMLRACDGAVTFDEVGDDSLMSLTTDTMISDDTWHHVALVVGVGVVQVYVDGLLEGSTTDGFPLADAGNPFTLGYAPGEIGLVSAQFDELLIHGVALGAPNVLERVWPPVPTVRFFAGTDPTASEAPYPLLEYAIHTGNPSATAVPAHVGCNRLLCDAAGYVAWWQFDALNARMLDIAGGHHITVGDGVLSGTGLTGGGAVFDGGWLGVTDLGIALDGFTVELAFNAETTTGEQVLLSLGAAEPVLEFAIVNGFLRGGAIGTEAQFTVGGEAPWHIAGLSRDGTALTLFGGEAEQTVTGSSELLEADSLRLGAALQAAASFVGILDDVRIMSRALSAAERLPESPLTWALGTGVGE